MTWMTVFTKPSNGGRKAWGLVDINRATAGDSKVSYSAQYLFAVFAVFASFAAFAVYDKSYLSQTICMKEMG
jgi:hypothetical protein